MNVLFMLFFNPLWLMQLFTFGAVAGLRGTGDWATSERPRNFREMILWRRPNGQAPLTALLSKMNSEKVNDPEFNWWEEEMNLVRLTVAWATGFATTDTLIAVSTAANGQNAQDLVPGDLLLVEKSTQSGIDATYTNEIVLVSTVNTVTTVTVVRGAAGSTAAPILQSVSMTKIGNAYSEGSNSPSTASRNPTKLFNYLQIFKTAYSITRTARDTYVYTGDPLKNERKRKMFDHSVAMEMAFLFGKRFEGTGANGKPERYTGGILQMMATYYAGAIKVYTTTPTANGFLDDVYTIWDYDSDAGSERIAFCGNGALNSLNKLALGGTNTRVKFDGVVDVYGMKLQRWVLPQGEIYLKTHPLFNTHARFTNDILIFDPGAMKYRYLLDTKFEDNIQANDADIIKGQWISECGLEFRHAKTSKWLSNFVVP